MRDYLTLADILAIHDDQIRRFGGILGVRDFGLIEAAIFRPQSGYYDDILGEAAALWESLSQNHPFLDGNKRVAFAATDVFLRINGWTLTAIPNEIYDHMMFLYESGQFNFTELNVWLRANVTREKE
ncbi:MAG: type II toxin-antitoxin system death-on-curing family toxin [Armatimonadaceae bacterium]